ncbi:MAG: polyisoprenoid-binding protein YceI [Lysobacterales bacterium]
MIDLNVEKNKATKVMIDLDMASVTTFNETRDNILMRADFYNVAQYPTIKILCKKIKGNKITAEFTFRDLRSLIDLKYVFSGINNNVNIGRRVAYIHLEGSIERKDFGIEYNKKDGPAKDLLGTMINFMFDIRAVEVL